MQRDRGQCFIQVEAAVVDRMRAMRRPVESYSQVILRLVELGTGPPQTAHAYRRRRERLERAESAPIGVASRRTEVRAKAVVPLRARNKLRRPPQTFAIHAPISWRPPSEDKDRREGRQPRALCRVPDGRGRDFEQPARRDSTNNREVAASAGRINQKAASVTRSSPVTGRVRHAAAGLDGFGRSWRLERVGR